MSKVNFIIMALIFMIFAYGMYIYAVKNEYFMARRRKVLPDPPKTLKELQSELDEAVFLQDYLKAAKLRDQIIKIEEKNGKRHLTLDR